MNRTSIRDDRSIRRNERLPVNAELSSLDFRPSVRLHIERLVLEGVPIGTAEVRHLQAALERELARLLSSAPAAGWTGGAIGRLDATPVHLASGGSAQTWGCQVARSLFSTMKSESQPPRAAGLLSANPEHRTAGATPAAR